MKTCTKLHSFYSTDTHDSCGEPCIKLIKYRFSKSRHYTCCYTSYDTAQRIFLFLGSFYKLHRLTGSFIIRHIYIIFTALFKVKVFGIYISYTLSECLYLDTQHFKCLYSYGTPYYSAYCFST